jgi:hypothetical protein
VKRFDPINFSEGQQLVDWFGGWPSFTALRYSKSRSIVVKLKKLMQPGGFQLDRRKTLPLAQGPLCYPDPILPDWQELAKAFSDRFNLMAAFWVDIESVDEQDILIEKFQQSGFQATCQNGNEPMERPIVGRLIDVKAVEGDFTRQIYFRRGSLWLMGNDGGISYAFAPEDVRNYDEALFFLTTLKLVAKTFNKTVSIGAGVLDCGRDHPFIEIASSGDLQLFPENYIDSDNQTVR